jgi:hypothetical protein
MKNLINVTETANFNTRHNIESYTYHSPTHWGAEGFIKINGSSGKWKLSYGSGGTNAEFSDILIADAMRQGFELAQQRLIKLQENY